MCDFIRKNWLQLLTGLVTGCIIGIFWISSFPIHAVIVGALLAILGWFIKDNFDRKNNLKKWGLLIKYDKRIPWREQGRFFSYLVRETKDDLKEHPLSSLFFRNFHSESEKKSVCKYIGKNLKDLQTTNYLIIVFLVIGFLLEVFFINSFLIRIYSCLEHHVSITLITFY